MSYFTLFKQQNLKFVQIERTKDDKFNAAQMEISICADARKHSRKKMFPWSADTTFLLTANDNFSHMHQQREAKNHW